MRTIPGYLTTSPIEKINFTSDLLVNENFRFSKKPVLVKNLIDDWPALEKWTMDFFDSNYGGISEFVSRSDSKLNTEDKHFSLSEYISYAKNSDDDNPYYFKSQFHRTTSLYKDYNQPILYPCWYSQISLQKRKYELSWIYVGAKGTFSEMHLDIWNSSAWNALISGKKLWVFYTKKQIKSLFKDDQFSWSDNCPTQLNKPLFCIQEPGDVVFTPSGWYHAVLNLEAGISITENFINETNYKEVVNFFEGRNQIKSAKSIERIAEENLKKNDYESKKN